MARAHRQNNSSTDTRAKILIPEWMVHELEKLPNKKQHSARVWSTIDDAIIKQYAPHKPLEVLAKFLKTSTTTLRRHMRDLK